MELLISVLAVVTVFLIVRLGYRWGFDPIDATFLSIGGYVGFLIVSGFLINLAPVGLSAWGILINVLVGLALALAISWLDVRFRLSPGFTPDGGWGQQLRQRPGRRATALLLAATVILGGALMFAHRAEIKELEPKTLSSYVDRHADGTSWFVVDNSTDSRRLVNVRFSELSLDFQLAPEQSWTVQLVPASGRFTARVTSGSQTELVRLDGLRTRGRPVISPSPPRPPFD